MTTKMVEPRLNEPRLIQMTADGSGEPVAVVLGGRRLAVAEVQNRWRIDDEWWRNEVSRMYYQLVLEDGQSITVFRDLMSGRWYRQSYG